MSEPTHPSAFIQRCLETQREYNRLKALGVSHEVALRESGFMAAVQGKHVDALENAREVRKIIAGDAE
jgi:hypothetical protein